MLDTGNWTITKHPKSVNVHAPHLSVSKCGRFLLKLVILYFLCNYAFKVSADTELFRLDIPVQGFLASS